MEIYRLSLKMLLLFFKNDLEIVRKVENWLAVLSVIQERMCDV